jgi:hypothetical protein
MSDTPIELWTFLASYVMFVVVLVCVNPRS